ncbi:hypothetical protein R3P38DRAFT_2909209 [Favolaschia claudopus]|uniref:Uncharacterized protein n=1 Tax=Favolaschia claudopus TaxID=2862362 RepID=A0AAW0CA64_9AGAR
MIGPRALLLLLTVLLFAFLAVAAPIPVTKDGLLVKKSLKQFNPRGELPNRVARDSAKPSGYVKRDAPKPSQVYKH